MSCERIDVRGGGSATGKKAYLAIVKRAFDCNVVDVGVCYSGHLGFLNGRDSALGMQDEDRHIRFVSQTVDRSTGRDQHSVGLVHRK